MWPLARRERVVWEHLSHLRAMARPGLLLVYQWLHFLGLVGWKRVSINSGSKELKEHVNEKTRKNARQEAEIVNDVYDADTVTTNYVQCWFHRFRSGIFDVKDAPRTGRPVVEYVDKTEEIIEIVVVVASLRS
ncbi:hypothetical protein TNCV_1217761 [Trichonephila clavipes]|nr:hypothetical protein TNCV_1217761 [Trichonephila clavipes]